MAFKVPSNFTPPTQAQTGGSGAGVSFYRRWWRSITDDGQTEVNFANAICDLTNPSSSTAINVNIVSDFPNAIDNFSELTKDGRKVLFEDNFDTGLDTLNKWSCVFDGALLPELRDAAAGSAAGDVFANLTESRLLLQVVDGQPLDNTIINESKNYIKIPETGTTYLEGQGVFEHSGAGDNSIFNLVNLGGSPQVVNKASWNIDVFDGSGNTNNPSSILLDFKKTQTLVLEFPEKHKGDVKFGFLVDNTLYYAHVFVNNNNDAVDSNFTSKSLNLPIRDQFEHSQTDSINRFFGLFNDQIGYYFQSLLDTSSTPGITAAQYLNSVVCYTVGADNISKRLPFSAGNKETMVNVTAADTPLFSLQCAPTLSGVTNRSVFNFDSLWVSTSSQDGNFGCYIKIFYNATLGGVPDFVSLPDNTPSALTIDFDATSISGGIELFSVPIMANKTVEFSTKAIFEKYRREFSRVQIDGTIISTQTFQQTLTIVCSPNQGTIPTTNIDVSVNILGGEIG